MSVFPTCVGVFPWSLSRRLCFMSLPHVRGGVSGQNSSSSSRSMSSPRAWGCFHQLPTYTKSPVVFPTCVGVFLFRPRSHLCSRSLPHVRGGVSDDKLIESIELESSPRAWGCFPGACARNVPPCGLPHVRGGVSPRQFLPHPHPASSPRAWGCFPGPAWRSSLIMVFPTCVGVFLTCMSRASYSLSSSPRAWGCFWRADYRHEHDMVFPTCVGVFPLKI